MNEAMTRMRFDDGQQVDSRVVFIKYRISDIVLVMLDGNAVVRGDSIIHQLMGTFSDILEARKNEKK
jgi:hypothetical protein